MKGDIIKYEGRYEYETDPMYGKSRRIGSLYDSESEATLAAKRYAKGVTDGYVYVNECVYASERNLEKDVTLTKRPRWANFME